MSKYEWTLEDAKAIGTFMANVEGTLKLICSALMILAGCAIIATFWMVTA